jgi:hypothetical protein
MCTEQLPPGGYPIAVKYIILYNKQMLLVLKEQEYLQWLVGIELCEELSVRTSLLQFYICLYLTPIW